MINSRIGHWGRWDRHDAGREISVENGQERAWQRHVERQMFGGAFALYKESKELKKGEMESSDCDLFT